MDEVRVKNFGAGQDDMFVGSIESFNKKYGSDPEAEVPTASESIRINGPVEWLYGPFTATRQFSAKYNKNIYIFGEIHHDETGCDGLGYGQLINQLILSLIEDPEVPFLDIFVEIPFQNHVLGYDEITWEMMLDTFNRDRFMDLSYSLKKCHSLKERIKNRSLCNKYRLHSFEISQIVSRNRFHTTAQDMIKEFEQELLEDKSELFYLVKNINWRNHQLKTQRIGLLQNDPEFLKLLNRIKKFYFDLILSLRPDAPSASSAAGVSKNEYRWLKIIMGNSRIKKQYLNVNKHYPEVTDVVKQYILMYRDLILGIEMPDSLIGNFVPTSSTAALKLNTIQIVYDVLSVLDREERTVEKYKIMMEKCKSYALLGNFSNFIRIIGRQLINIRTLSTDVYNILRIFKTYDTKRYKISDLIQPEKANNVIIYGGNSHAVHARAMLNMLEFQLLEESQSDTDNPLLVELGFANLNKRCVEIKNFKQPFFTREAPPETKSKVE